jgi:hypothetical protein
MFGEPEPLVQRVAPTTLEELRDQRQLPPDTAEDPRLAKSSVEMISKDISLDKTPTHNVLTTV